MFSVMILAAAMASPPATNEVFKVGADGMRGPCQVTIEGKPTAEPPPACAAAIAAAKTARTQAILYFAWAYSLNEKNASVEALPNLEKAVALAPNFINAIHERGYTYNDLGFYDRGLADGNREVQLAPDAPSAYSERAFARHFLADFEGALADRLKVIALLGTHPDRETGVAVELMWLGRHREAADRLVGLPPSDDRTALAATIDRRRKFKPDGGEVKRCTMTTVGGDRAMAQKLVDDCSWAFDHAREPVKRADYLTVRSIMDVIATQDRGANTTDLKIAIALDPRNPQRHINYGNALVGNRRSWGARNAFDLALAAPALSNRDKAMALAGRGRARFNLGDLAGARSDAAASLESDYLFAGALLSGDLAERDGNKEGAKKHWMAAYRLGLRDDSLIERLKSVGVVDPAKESK